MHRLLGGVLALVPLEAHERMRKRWRTVFLKFFR